MPCRVDRGTPEPGPAVPMDRFVPGLEDTASLPCGSSPGGRPGRPEDGRLHGSTVVIHGRASRSGVRPTGKGRTFLLGLVLICGCSAQPAVVPVPLAPPSYAWRWPPVPDGRGVGDLEVPVDLAARIRALEQACAQSELDAADRLWRDIAADHGRRILVVPEALGRRLTLVGLLLGHPPGAFAAAPSR